MFYCIHLINYIERSIRLEYCLNLLIECEFVIMMMCSDVPVESVDITISCGEEVMPKSGDVVILRCCRRDPVVQSGKKDGIN